MPVISIANIFSYSVVYLFILLIISFVEKKFLILYSLIYDFIYDCHCVLRNLYLALNHKSHFLNFLLEVLLSFSLLYSQPVIEKNQLCLDRYVNILSSRGLDNREWRGSRQRGSFMNRKVRKGCLVEVTFEIPKQVRSVIKILRDRWFQVEETEGFK